MTRMWSAEWWAQRRKGIIAALGALATVAVALYGPTSTVGQIGYATIAVLTALGVYVLPNAPMPEVQPQGRHAAREVGTDSYDGW